MSSTTMPPESTVMSTRATAQLLAEANETTTRVVGVITKSQLELPTPCPGWDVAQLREHVIGAAAMFHDALEPTDPEGVVQLPFGLFPRELAETIAAVEILVHGCDLAVAIDRRDLVDQQLCAEARHLAERSGFDAFRQPGMFGPAVTAGPGASELDRLLAFTGRHI